MAGQVYAKKLDELYLKVSSPDQGIEQEISEHFTFWVPGAEFTPKYKEKLWDGKIRLYMSYKRTMYYGLLNHLKQFCLDRGYEFILEFVPEISGLTKESIVTFIDSLNLYARGSKLEIRDYQYDAVYHALEEQKALLWSPTSSGKSMIIYSMLRFHLEQNRRIMIVVPSTNLVEQLFSDFQDYSSHNGFDVDANVQKLYYGHSKDVIKPILITTWQSIYKWNEKELKKLKLSGVMIDEAHQIKAKSLITILERLKDVQYRIGLTGTIEDAKCNTLTIEGLTGPIYRVTTTKNLIDTGHVADLKIRCFLLGYAIEDRIAVRNLKLYQKEIQFLVNNRRRNLFIRNLAISTSGNTLILFQFVAHGKELLELLSNHPDIINSNRKIYFIYGSIATAERERIRQELSTDTNAIVIGSYQTVATGVNIPSIENIIFASPSKSKIRNLQSIGRGLRLHHNKSYCTLFDISDDLSIKAHDNFSLEHFKERLKIYSQEQFKYKLYRYSLA